MAFFTNFWPTGHVGLLDWYTLSVGLFALAGLGAHGATFLTSKTTRVIRDRAKAAGRLLWISTLFLGAIITIETGALRSDLLSALVSRPLSVAFLLLAFAATVGVLNLHWSNRDGPAFAGSCLFIAAVIGARAAASFPVLLQSTLDPQQSVSAYQAAASHHSLVIAFRWWLIAAPLALTWHVLASRSFRGRIVPELLIPSG
jgi:cytochrome d ubiquinol oxidase subunit II